MCVKRLSEVQLFGLELFGEEPPGTEGKEREGVWERIA